MKKALTILLLISFICVNFSFWLPVHARTYETFTVKDVDKVIEFPEDYQPIKYSIGNGFYIYLLPLKPIAEHFGCSYSYDGKTGNATVINPKYNFRVVFPTDGNMIIANGNEIRNIMGEYDFYSERINGKIYIQPFVLSYFLYRKSSTWEDNALVLYDKPLTELESYYNDYELIYENGKKPYIEGDVYSEGYTAVAPIKQTMEFLGYSVSLDMGNKVMDIRSEKGTIKIVFKEEYPRWRINLIQYKNPKIYFNGKLQTMESSYAAYTFKLFSRDGTLYTSITSIQNILNEFLGKNYYSVQWAFTEGQLIWQDEDYQKIKDAAKNPSFSDVKSSDWYYNSVTRAVKEGLISGYADNTFRPVENITVSEFIKMLVAAMGYDLKPVKGDYWARNYINKALEIGLIEKDEFDNYDRPIARGEMAKLILRAEKNEAAFDNWERYASSFSDYSALTPQEREIAGKILASGIMSGFADGSFGFHKNATRAQACTILLKFLNKEARTVPEL